jgi:hypothetical protein
MLDREIVTVSCEIRTTQVNALCRNNVEFFKDMYGGTYIDHLASVNSWLY